MNEDARLRKEARDARRSKAAAEVTRIAALAWIFNDEETNVAGMFEDGHVKKEETNGGRVFGGKQVKSEEIDGGRILEVNSFKQRRHM